MKTILTILLAFTIPTYADTCPVAPIKKGQSAPCDGFYFNKDAENQADQYRDDANFYKKLSDSLTQKTNIMQDENDVLQKRLDLYIKESSTLTKEQTSRDNTEEFIRIGCFSLGILVTALIVRNIRQ